MPHTFISLPVWKPDLVMMSSTRILLLLCSLLILPALAPGAAWAAGAAANSTGATTAGSSKEIGQLLGTLEDPAQRERLIAELKALQAAQRQAEAKATPTIAESGAKLLQSLSDRLGDFGSFVDRMGRGLGDPTRLMTWLRKQVTDPAQRALWGDVLIKLGIVLGSGLLAGFAARLGVSRPMARLESRMPATEWQRLPPLPGRLVLDVLPVLAFTAAGFAALAAVVPSERVRLILLAAINAAVIVGAVTALVRFVFSPFAPGLRLFRLNDETAAYVYLWLRRLVGFAVYGYMALQAALLLGLPRAGYALTLKLLGFFLLGMLVVLVLQNREVVAAEIRGSDPAKERLGAVRRRLAETWHILAIFYLAGLFGVWALEIRGGFEYMLRSTAMTVLLLVLYRLVLVVAQRINDALLAVNRDLLRRYPLIEQRADRYLPFLRRLLLIGLQIVLVLAILGVWRIDIAAILQSATGRELVGRLLRSLLVVGLSLAVWEVASAAITLYLERTDRNGEAVVRSARIRTLLPLIRNALLVLISVMATLMVLTQLGIDIAPLLAGAGVVGLAVGFGAQTLVKDVITGAFILFEDTVHIGDVANVNGTAGVVEGMTIRTVRLRDLTGTVHTIPFGAITAISNLTKDFSYYLVDMGVAYREDTDRVVEVMKEAFAELAADPVFAPDIIDDLEVLGVDRFADSAVVVRARIKTLPIKQWGVGREYNRRLKQKFDAYGIEIPFPHQTIYFGEDREGKAPPLRLLKVRETPPAVAPAADQPPTPTPPPAASAPATGEAADSAAAAKQEKKEDEGS